MLSSKLTVIVNIIILLVFGAVIGLEYMEAQEYGMTIAELFNLPKS